jgi:hypothetical protein
MGIGLGDKARIMRRRGLAGAICLGAGRIDTVFSTPNKVV